MSDSPPPFDDDPYQAYQAQRTVMPRPLTPAEIAAQDAAQIEAQDAAQKLREERRRRDRQRVIEQQSIDAGQRSARAFYDGQHPVTKTAPGAANKPPDTPWQNPLYAWEVKTKKMEQTQKELDEQQEQIDEQRRLAELAKVESRREKLEELLKKADDEDVEADKARQQARRLDQERRGGRRKSASIKSKRKSKFYFKNLQA